MNLKLSLQLLSMLWLLLLPLSLIAQETKYTINGYIKDHTSGEELIGATIYIPTLEIGTVSNVYGFYSLTVPAGEHELLVSYVGYDPLIKTLAFTADETIDFEIYPKEALIKEVVVKAEKEDSNVDEVAMSQVKMQVDKIKKMPALFGEADIIKAIQLLPGVQTVGEGTSGFYVRGGAVDQNLILLDEAPVYNASHLLGFFSVFNPDAIKDVQLYKGGIPAEYGGRLSSVLDIRMKEGNSREFEGSGGIGTLSSRLTLEGPIVKDKGSFIVSGRRTYADIFLNFSSDTNLRNSKLYFYDLNAKVNYKLNDKNRIFLSGYFGRDVFGDPSFSTSWGNQTGTLRWNHVFSKKLFSNLTFIYSDFDYSLGETGGAQGFEWTSKLSNVSAKLDMNYFLNPSNTIKFGVQTIRHQIQPGTAKGIGEGTIFNEFTVEDVNAYEHAAYISNEQKVTSRLKAVYGLRFSAFQNIGETNFYSYDDQYEIKDTTVYDKGEVFNTYTGLEPRIGLRYTLDDKSSAKLSYNRTYQYIQLASNSTASSPLDIWFPSSPNVKPQIADQIAAGYFRNFKDNAVEGSVEVYYKKMQNAIDFKDHAELLLNPLLEGELRFGDARSYGLELLLKKQKGALTGWLSYTLARTERQITSINSGNWYPAKYDKTHDISLVLSYDFKERFNASANWVYSTGSAVTMPTGRYEYLGMQVPVYSDRNAERLPAYHRMDLAFTMKGKRKLFKKIETEKIFSVYNVYYRKNPYSINFRQDETDPNKTYAEKTYLFAIIPSATINFKF